MKLTPATSLTAVAIIAAGGFMAGRISSPEKSSDAQDSRFETKSARAAQRESSGGGMATKSGSRTTRSEHSDKVSSKGHLARLEAIMGNGNVLDRNRALLAYIDQLAPQDFESAISRFKELGMTENRHGEYALLLTAWAQADPLTARAYSSKNPTDDFSRDTILTAWATKDPESAIQWAKSNFSGDGANPYFVGIIGGLAESDPVRATELLTSMPRSEERGQGLDFILPQVLKMGADAARSWISALTDERLRNGAMTRAAEQLAETDPAGTAAWLLANPGEAKQRMMDNVYATWASNDKQAALSSFSSLPAGEDRSNALRGLVNNIATENPKEAVSLMNRFPSDVNDHVLQNFVWHSMGSDPALAATEISLITDADQRDHTYRRTLGMWMDNDPAAAQAWINSNPLPETVQSYLQHRAPKK